MEWMLVVLVAVLMVYTVVAFGRRFGPRGDEEKTSAAADAAVERGRAEGNSVTQGWHGMPGG